MRNLLSLCVAVLVVAYAAHASAQCNCGTSSPVSYAAPSYNYAAPAQVSYAAPVSNYSAPMASSCGTCNSCCQSAPRVRTRIVRRVRSNNCCGTSVATPYYSAPAQTSSCCGSNAISYGTASYATPSYNVAASSCSTCSSGVAQVNYAAPINYGSTMGYPTQMAVSSNCGCSGGAVNYGTPIMSGNVIQGGNMLNVIDTPTVSGGAVIEGTPIDPQPQPSGETVKPDNAKEATPPKPDDSTKDGEEDT